MCVHVSNQQLDDKDKSLFATAVQHKGLGYVPDIGSLGCYSLLVSIHCHWDMVQYGSISKDFPDSPGRVLNCGYWLINPLS